MKVNVIWSYLLFSFSSFAQDNFATISGQIIDVETKEPLSFATINIQNTAKGVVANVDGEFDFTFLKAYLSDTLIFSMTGYQTEKVLAQSLTKGQPLKIGLVSKVVMLAEVVVTEKKLSAADILDLALGNIKNNYPVKPFEFEAFYRDYKLENDKCISIYEAAISAYDKGYDKVVNKNVFKEKVVLKQVRKSLSVKYKTHVFSINVMKELLKLNDVRYQSRGLSKQGRRRFEYKLAGYSTIHDRLMYNIEVENWNIYVDVVTYAIPRIELNFNWKEGIDKNQWVRDTIRYNQTKATMLMDFQMIDDLYYPRYCSFTAALDALNPTTNELIFTSYLMQEYMVTDINFTPNEKPEKKDRMDPHLMIEEQDVTYDPEFWKNYNIIKLHPRDEKLIQGLEERMKLEEQFSETNQ